MNNNLPLYFMSSIIVGFCILAIYIILVIPIKPNVTTIFWILFFISAFIFTGLIISKKMFFANIYNEPLMGSKGDLGALGTKGESYVLKTYPEKCYNELILTAEDYLIQNMKINNIEYDPYEYQIKNLYFKQLLKNICQSKHFNDYVLLGEITNSNDESCSKSLDSSSNTQAYNDNTCNYNEQLTKRVYGNSTEQCNTDKTNEPSSNTNNDIDIDKVENRYDIIVAELKIMVVKWIKYILLNNKNEDNKLKESLGYQNSSKIKDIIPSLNDNSNSNSNSNSQILNNNLREDLRYNNRTGHKFFADYFLNDKYFDEYLIKKNNERTDSANYNPFDKIKESYITLDKKYKPFTW